MTKHYLILGSLACALCMSSCHNGECESAPLTGQIPDIGTTSSALAATELVGDAPAGRAFNRVQDILRSGAELRMNIYELKSPDSIDGLIASRRFAAPSIKDTDTHVIVQDGDIACAWNKNSLYEECADESVFNINPGVARGDLKPDGFYIDRANDILNRDIAPRTTAHYDFLPYKRKLGINASASIADPQNVTETVFEVAVGFASELDGWPVIGPGGKIYIHILPDGAVAAKKIYRKLPGDAIATLTQKDIKSADEALAEVIKAEDIDMTRYRVIRRDFGYFYWGKNSIQNVIAPHYVFFFAPTDSMFDTQIYHIVSAVKGDAGKIVAADRDLEIARKHNNIKNVEPAQEKK